MQALSDEQQMERLEKKVDDGFREMREEFRSVRSETKADFRTLIAVILGLYATVIFGFAGILLQQHL